MLLKLLGFVLVITLQILATDAGKKVVCYWGSWSVYRTGNGKFEAKDIDPKLCTHVIYSFIGLNADNTVKMMDSWNDIDKGGFQKVVDLKKKNKNLKVMVAIGGWNEGSSKYSSMASTPASRKTFIKSAIDFVHKYKFDGLDIDWEYPAQRGGVPSDKANFGKLIKEFRATAGKNFILTAAVGASDNTIKTSYDVPTMSKYLDAIHVMTYDLHGSFEPVTGINAPLKASSKDKTPEAKQLNVEACIHSWIKAGAAPQKLVMGIPTYGRSFTVNPSGGHGIGVPATGGGTAGPYTQEAGMLGYNELCEMQKDGSWKKVWDKEQHEPYAYTGNQWVGYDDARSVKDKVAFGKKEKLGGFMIWSLETDDFKGICGKKYPILSAINSNL